MQASCVENSAAAALPCRASLARPLRLGSESFISVPDDSLPLVWLMERTG